MKNKIDFDNRDPESINVYVQASFGSVIAETDVRSIDCGWKNSYLCFTHGRNISYNFLTIIFGMPLALIWGILFAIFSFVTIWLMTPTLQLIKMILLSVRSFYSTFLYTGLTPLYESFSVLFSRINVRISTNQSMPIAQQPNNTSNSKLNSSIQFDNRYDRLYNV